MSEAVFALLVVMVIVLVMSLRRAFVRIDAVDRSSESLFQRVAGLEMALTVALREAQFRAPAAPPQPAVPARTGLPPEGGNYRIESEVGLPPEGGNYRIESEAGLPPEGGNYRIESEAEEAPTQRAPVSPLSFRLQAERASERTPSSDSCSFRLQAEERHAESLETQIGSRWLLYIGMVAIVIGVAYFEKLAIENQWLGETARVIQGGVLGLVLTFVGLRFVRAGYDAYGQIITGGGAAILYLSAYAAFNYYHLIPQPVAFALMVAITAMVAWLADRLQSQGLALFAVGSGFAAPFLVPGTTDAQIALFGYVTILIGGTMWLSHRRSWPALNIVSYVATVMTVAAWADSFYSPEKYLRTELFLTLFCAMFLYVLRRIRTSTGTGAEAAALTLWSTPIAYYAASLMVLQDHSTALLVWLVALMLIGGILSERAGTGAGLAVWGAVTVPLLLWIVTHLDPVWHASGLSTIAAVYLIALAAQLRRTFAEADDPSTGLPSTERRAGGAGAPELGAAGIVWLHLNGLLMFAAAYFLINETHVAITGALAAAFALWQGGLAGIVLRRQRDQSLHFAALGFTLLSIAIALQWDGPAVAIGWAAEGAVVIGLGLSGRRQWMRVAGAVLFAVAFGIAMSLLATDRAVSEAVFFNPHAAAAAAIAALSYVLAWLHGRDAEAQDRDLGIGLGLVVAQVATLALLTSEIHAYWALREGHFARELMVSVTWGVYATALIVIGLQRAYAPIRYFAIVVFAATIFKVFVLDMADLERIYRVSSIIGLGMLLLLTSYLYTRSKRT